MQKTKIKLAIIAGKMNKGGVESIIMSHLSNIDKDIFDIDIFVDNDSKYIPLELEQYVNNIYLIPPYQKLKAYKAKLKDLFLMNKYDIVHSHINTLSVFPLSVAKKCGIKYRIAHSHSTLGKGEFKRNVLKSILRLFSKTYATHFFACGNQAALFQFGKKAFDNNLITIIPNGIKSDQFIFNKKYKDELPDELKNKIIIGHIGRFEEVKNHKFMLELISKLDDNYHLMLIGDGNLFSECKKLANKLNIEHKVSFVGCVNDTYKYYSMFDLFILPSFYEGFPVTSIEAQCNGLKVMYSNRISKDVDLLGNAKYLDLDINVWVDMIKNTKFDRKPNALTIIKEKGYDEISSCKILTNKYMEIINGK